MEEKTTQVQESEIDIRQILGIIKKHLIPIILVTVICGAGFYIYSKLFIQKKYQASATLIVNNLSSDRQVTTSSELVAAQNLAEVYAIIVKSDTVLQPVIENLGLSISYEALANSVSVSTVNSTQVITISMQHADAEYAKKVVAEIVSIGAPIIQEKVEAGSVKVISEARIANNNRPVSPNSMRNGLLGALIGLVLILAVVFIKEFMNNTFKTEDDVYKSLGIPLLGMIPAVDEKEFNQNV